MKEQNKQKRLSKRLTKILLTSVMLLTTNSLVANDTNRLSISGLAFSHHKSNNRNENHKYIGGKYSKGINIELGNLNSLNNKENLLELAITSELSTFKNSYNDRTTSLTVGVTYLPFNISKLKLGTNLSVGIQKGYCLDTLLPKQCKQNDNNIGFFILPSLEAQYPITPDKNVGLNITYSGAVMARFYIDLISW